MMISYRALAHLKARLQVVRADNFLRSRRIPTAVRVGRSGIGVLVDGPHGGEPTEEGLDTEQLAFTLFFVSLISKKK
jgi:hypothetical protein